VFGVHAGVKKLHPAYANVGEQWHEQGHYIWHGTHCATLEMCHPRGQQRGGGMGRGKWGRKRGGGGWRGEGRGRGKGAGALWAHHAPLVAVREPRG